MAEVLLDSTFILPTLGVGVKEITEREMQKLLKLSNKLNIHCCYVSMVEVLGKVARNLKKNNEHQGIVSEGLRSLFESETYKWLNPDIGAYQIALDMRMKGHQDMIDNLLYSTAVSHDLYFLSLDDDLHKFLIKKGYNTNLVVNMKSLEKII